MLPEMRCSSRSQRRYKKNVMKIAMSLDVWVVTNLPSFGATAPPRQPYGWPMNCGKPSATYWRGNHYGVTISVGLVSYDEEDAALFESFLALADAACFLAKEKGRNRVQVSSSVDDEVRQQHRNMDEVSRLKEAIKDDRILLYGQKIIPLKDTATDRIEYREVLARLVDLEGKIVGPAQFVPAAERFGLIEELDRHVIRKTFSYIQRAPADLRARSGYFINISGITLSAPDFQDFIVKTLAAYPDVAPSKICFEVTETAAISNLQRTATSMKRLIEKNFSFALDDFGSGMASFAYIHQLPVQFIKIDGEIIKGITTQPACAIIVEAVTKIARTMNMQTIAESVEFSQMIPHLKEVGLDFGQGYAFHRPAKLAY
jgi:EAL domain-containing protein (putative c-di-GMP-specific phosphodiesterase class I)